MSGQTALSEMWARSQMPLTIYMQRVGYANRFCVEAIDVAAKLKELGRETGNAEFGKSCRNNLVSILL